MKYALFLGCNIPARLKQYEASARAVMGILDVDLIDIPDFNCCGYPMRNYDYDSFLFSSIRNIALAQMRDLDIITLCKCCYGSLKRAEYLMKNDSADKEKMDEHLKKENLEFTGGFHIKHLLSVLYHDVGPDKLREKIVKPFKGLKIATHYGCHALRPKDVVQFDDPGNPGIFDKLVEATGAESVDWESRLECCGAPLLGINDDLSIRVMEKKIHDSRAAGADYLCVACPYCHMQFDRIQNRVLGAKDSIAPIIYTQLLGLSMGIDADALQIGVSEIDIRGIEDFAK